MKTIFVKHTDTIRDGGTRIFTDENGTEYWQDFRSGKVYDKWPHGVDGMNAREQDVFLWQVTDFEQTRNMPMIAVPEATIIEYHAKELHNRKLYSALMELKRQFNTIKWPEL